MTGAALVIRRYSVVNDIKVVDRNVCVDVLVERVEVAIDVFAAGGYVD